MSRVIGRDGPGELTSIIDIGLLRPLLLAAGRRTEGSRLAEAMVEGIGEKSI